MTELRVEITNKTILFKFFNGVAVDDRLMSEILSKLKISVKIGKDTVDRPYIFGSASTLYTVLMHLNYNYKITIE